ncbi:MAG: hypothetical protein AB7F76_08125 [Parvibaculaceae bacterium]|jgi:hypothetical protein
MMHAKAAIIALATLGAAVLITPAPSSAMPAGGPISIEKSTASNLVEVRHRKWHNRRHWRHHRHHWRRDAWRHRHHHHRRWARRYWCDPYYEYCGRRYWRPGFGIYLNF